MATIEIKTIECVAFFYRKGTRGNDLTFIQRNKSRCCVDIFDAFILRPQNSHPSSLDPRKANAWTVMIDLLLR